MEIWKDFYIQSLAHWLICIKIHFQKHDFGVLLGNSAELPSEKCKIKFLRIAEKATLKTRYLLKVANGKFKPLFNSSNHGKHIAKETIYAMQKTSGEEIN